MLVCGNLRTLPRFMNFCVLTYLGRSQGGKGQIDPHLPFSFFASAISSGNDKDLYPSPLSHLNQIGQSEKDFIKIKMLKKFV